MNYTRCKSDLQATLKLLNQIKSNATLPEKPKYKILMAYNYIDQAIDDIQEYVELELRGLLNGDETNEILNKYVRGER